MENRTELIHFLSFLKIREDGFECDDDGGGAGAGGISWVRKILSQLRLNNDEVISYFRVHNFTVALALQDSKVLDYSLQLMEDLHLLD